MRLSDAQRGVRVNVRMGGRRGPYRRGIVCRVHGPSAINPSGYITVYIAHWLGESLLGNFHPDDVEPVPPEEAPE